MSLVAGHPVLGNPAIVLPGIPATIDPQPVIDQMVRRASSPGFETWWRRAESVGMCAHPIQLTGSDEFGRQQVVWTRCNNRRASVCPSCSDLYARDTWQLVHAGTAGGHHDVPENVAERPQVFTTLTAPSFGPVHSSTGATCRDHRRGYTRCRHGKPLWCSHVHDDADTQVGQPLCQECYDYLGHVLFTWYLPELWRRFTITLRRSIAKALKADGHELGSVRVSFVKVTEMQARGIPHIHAMIRLDPTSDDHDPHGVTGSCHTATDSSDPNRHGPAAARGGGEPRHPNSWVSPVSAAELAVHIQQAARSVTINVTTMTAGNDPSPTSPLTVRFGGQIDTQPLNTDHHRGHNGPTADGHASARLSPRRVARYLAKYVTKSLHDFGITARRLSSEAIADLDVSDHVRAILATIVELADSGMGGIERWLHTLGFRGHITTKSRRYSTTMGALRAHRATWTRKQTTNLSATHDNPTPSVANADVMGWEFDRAGYTCLGDRALVISGALRAITARRLGREAVRDTLGVDDWIGVPDG